MTIKTINPANQVVLNEYETLNETSAHDLVLASHNAFTHWRHTSFSSRQKLMLRLSDLLRRKSTSFAQLITQEMGKPFKQACAEIEKCAWVCEHYAKQAETYLQSRDIETEMSKVTVSYQPLGVILAIMPWNFPFWQVFRFAAPTIMAGNTAILKHASVSLGTGNAIEQLFIEAGFDPHIFQHAILDSKGVADMIAKPEIAALSFTGSDATGRIVAGHAAAHLKKSVLELGGSDPYLVLADADLDLAARCIVSSRLNNCGQVCVAAKRIIVVDTVHDRLVEAILAAMAEYQMADPLLPTTKLGPMARHDLRETLHNQVIASINQGATLITGGNIPSSIGYYYPATLLTNVTQGMPAFDEELFGPVIAITRVSSQQEAIVLANNSQFGLGAAVFTNNIALGEEIATKHIEAGSCFVNAFVASDPRVPFGGIKQSGFGRELSWEGIHEFVYAKTVAIK